MRQLSQVLGGSTVGPGNIVSAGDQLQHQGHAGLGQLLPYRGRWSLRQVGVQKVGLETIESKATSLDQSQVEVTNETLEPMEKQGKGRSPGTGAAH